MPTSMFGEPIASNDAWDDQSTYTFVLKAPDDGAAAPTAFMLRSAAAGPTQVFRSNVVVIRKPKESHETVQDFAAKQRQAVTGGISGMRLIEEGPCSIGSLRGHAQRYAVTLDAPLPSLTQWQVTLERGPHFYQACCTSTQSDFARDKPKFEALLRSWAG